MHMHGEDVYVAPEMGQDSTSVLVQTYLMVHAFKHWSLEVLIFVLIFKSNVIEFEDNHRCFTQQPHDHILQLNPFCSA